MKQQQEEEKRKMKKEKIIEAEEMAAAIRARFENNELIPDGYTSSSAFEFFATALFMLEIWAKKKGINNFKAFEMYADSLDTVMRNKFSALIKLLYAYELKA